MKRRQFLRTVSGIAVTTSVAGCAGSGNAADGTTVSERVVRDVPEDGDQTDNPSVTETSSPDVALDGLTFQRAGQRGIVVAGDARNESDRAFADVTVEAALYDEREAEDDLYDSTVQQTSRDSLDAGEQWQWALTFRDTPLAEIDYYSATVRAGYE